MDALLFKLKRRKEKSGYSSDDEHSRDEKRRRNALPDRNWREIKELLGITRIIQGQIIPDEQIPLDNLHTITREILWKWDQRSSLFEFPGRNENECRDYIKDVLLSVVPKGGNLAITTAKNKGIEIYTLTPSEMPVLCQVETKKSDIEQGRAQLYPQLKACYELAKENEGWDNPIYGIISTVMNWVFVRYNGKEWVELEPLAITTAHDKSGIQNVVEILYKIIQHQQNLLQDVVKKDSPSYK